MPRINENIKIQKDLNIFELDANLLYRQILKLRLWNFQSKALEAILFELCSKRS